MENRVRDGSLKRAFRHYRGGAKPCYESRLWLSSPLINCNCNCEVSLLVSLCLYCRSPMSACMNKIGAEVEEMPIYIYAA